MYGKLINFPQNAEFTAEDKERPIPMKADLDRGKKRYESMHNKSYHEQRLARNLSRYQLSKTPLDNPKAHNQSNLSFHHNGQKSAEGLPTATKISKVTENTRQMFTSSKHYSPFASKMSKDELPIPPRPDPTNEAESFKLMYEMYKSYHPYKLKISPKRR